MSPNATTGFRQAISCSLKPDQALNRGDGSLTPSEAIPDNLAQRSVAVRLATPLPHGAVARGADLGWLARQRWLSKDHEG